MIAPPPAPSARPFRLLQTFSLVAGLVISTIAIGHALLMSRFLTEQLFQREGAVTRDFVQNVLDADGSVGYLAAPQDAELARRFNGSIVHLTTLPDVLRANVHSREGKVLWSTQPGLVGRDFGRNEELAEALRGELVVHAGSVGPAKREHEGLSDSARYFVETYIPVTDAAGRVLGVVEIYKVPLALADAIQAGRRWAMLAALAGALALFGSLTWLIHRADRTLRRQHAQLLEAETLAAVGQLAAAVAHNVRNPLASIRSSAELSLDATLERAQASAADILRDADRISERINELLRLATPHPPAREAVALGALLAGCAAEMRPLFERRSQLLLQETETPEAAIWGDAQLLRHVLHSLLANACEALPAGGRCTLRLRAGTAGRHLIEVQDDGPGIAADALEAVQKPFVTTKPQGLGLGLVLARRSVERMGGHFALISRPGAGTAVRIELPKA